MAVLPKEKSPVEQRLEKQVVLLYGRAKIGKSTFASHFPDPVFLATEPGLNHLSVHKVNINSWVKFLEACAELAEGKHAFKTMVIDTIDKLVVFCADHVCRENGINHPSDMPHGRGWSLITTELERALTKLSSLPYGLVMISHCEIEEIETKTRKYTRFSITIGGKNKNLFLNIADLILFIDSEVAKDGEEQRIIRTKPSMNYEAGDRSSLLPETLPLDYKEFAKYFK